MEFTDHPNVALTYYKDEQPDIMAGSTVGTYDRACEWIRHAHLHQFNRLRWGIFPYPGLFV